MEEGIELQALEEALKVHRNPGVLACVVYEILNVAGYSDQELWKMILALGDIVACQNNSNKTPAFRSGPQWEEID